MDIQHKKVENVSVVKKNIYDYIFLVNQEIEANYPYEVKVEAHVLFTIIFKLVDFYAYKKQLEYTIGNKKYLKRMVDKEELQSTVILLSAELNTTKKSIELLEQLIPENICEYEVLSGIKKYLVDLEI